MGLYFGFGKCAISFDIKYLIGLTDIKNFLNVLELGAQSVFVQVLEASLLWLSQDFATWNPLGGGIHDSKYLINKFFESQ